MFSSVKVFISFQGVYAIVINEFRFFFSLYFLMGGVVKVDIYEVDTKIELYVDTF